MKAVAFIFALAFGASQSIAGTLVGIVKAVPKPELQQAQGAGGGKYDSKQFKFVETIKYDEIKDFIVYIDQPMTNEFPKQTVEVVTQQDAKFHPHIVPVLRGTTVNWPNHDDIFHNVFSVSDAKTFDLGLYKDPEKKSVDFDKSGRVDVFCSIHSKMNCVILVLENPFFAATDAKGRYKITGLPPGRYKVKAWHERLPGQVQEVTIKPEGEMEVNFTVWVGNLSKGSK